MRVIEASLLEFLRDGLLAGVGLHMSRSAVSTALGRPEMLADYYPPTGVAMLWRYGELSVGFSRADDRVFFIQILPHRGPPQVVWRSASGPVTLRVMYEDVRSFLDEHSVRYTTRQPSRIPEIVTEGRVVLTFDPHPLRLKQMLLGVVDSDSG